MVYMYMYHPESPSKKKRYNTMSTWSVSKPSDSAMSIVLPASFPPLFGLSAAASEETVVAAPPPSEAQIREIDSDVFCCLYHPERIPEPI